MANKPDLVILSLSEHGTLVLDAANEHKLIARASNFFACLPRIAEYLGVGLRIEMHVGDYLSKVFANGKD